MAKSNVNESQIKARRTSLGKKTTDELIAIILRKDKSERNMNSKIQELTNHLIENEKANDSLITRISELITNLNDTKELVNVKQEQLDGLVSDKHALEDKCNNYCKEVVRLKSICNFRRKVLFYNFGVIGILMIVIIILSILMF